MNSETDLLCQAMELRRNGKCKEAISIYESISDENPLVFGSIGMIYHRGVGDVTQDLNRAIEYYQRAMDNEVTPAIGRALIAAYYEKSFEGIDHCELYLEKISSLNDPVSQLSCLWLFALRFRTERSKSEQSEGRAFGEKAAQMGNVHARKAMAEVYFAERKLLRAAWMYFRALFSELRLRLVDPEDIRLQKH
jgi:TPR repeat protein